MNPPEEMMVETFLPSMRVLVARRLRADGFSQGRIASMLGVTQAAVSQYLSSKAGKAYAALASLSVGEDDADRYAALLAEDAKRSPVYAVETLGTMWKDLLGRGALCAAHRAMHPALAGCDVCVRQYGAPSPKGQAALDHVAKAVKLLERSPYLAAAMPEVSVNVAYLGGEGESVQDVIAVPGRIVRVKGYAKAMQPPEFGASEHMARVLLRVRARNPTAKAAVNLRYDKAMGRALKRMRLKVLELGGRYPAGQGDPVLAALTLRLIEEPGRFDAVADAGGVGVEPNVYVFGEDAVKAAELAVRIAEEYSAHDAAHA